MKEVPEMKVYRHELKGVRFAVMLLFFIVLLTLNILILPGEEELPVKVFVAVFTLLWLAFTVDSLAARIEVDDRGIGQYSWLFKRHIGWDEVCGVRFGQRWVLGTFMPRHVIIEYKEGSRDETRTITLHGDMNDWEDLIGRVVVLAPAGVIDPDVRDRFVSKCR